MKSSNAICFFVLAMLTVAGCKKSPKESPVTTPIGAIASVRKAFPNPGPDVGPSIDKITYGIRYGEFSAALAELDKLSANPNLNPEQKKSLADATDQVKKTMATAAPK